MRWTQGPRPDLKRFSAASILSALIFVSESLHAKAGSFVPACQIIFLTQRESKVICSTQ